jgi:hypothetical protein
MPINPTMLGPVRTGLINALGRDYPIRALFEHAKPALYAGVVEIASDRFQAFTVGLVRLDVIIWDNCFANATASAIYTLFDVLSDVAYGTRKNPHV